MKLEDNAEKISSHFNRYFIDKPKKINQSIQHSLHDYNNLVPINDRSFRMLPATTGEVISVIGKLKSSGGGLSFPVRFLKMISTVAAVHIASLFNLSVRNCTYPSLLKVARVVPVYKRGDARLTQNYRPISILPPLNKVFEKLIYKRMMSFVNDNNILSANQFGFRKGLDTGQATLKLIHTVLERRSEGKSTVCVFLDFSSAFDTLEREILLRKCAHYGFRGPTNEFLGSYLSGRRQYVSSCSQHSAKHMDLLDNEYGVPQGSCLGPLFFLLYSNDLNYLASGLPLIQFADDSSLLISDMNLGLLAERANFYLYKLQDWANYNRLALNHVKTKCMFFGANKRYLPPIKINDNKIEIVDSFKYLGFHLDRRLVHAEHIRQLHSKVKRLSYVAFKLKGTLNEKASLAFYYGLVQSSLSYGIVVYGGANSTWVMKKL